MARTTSLSLLKVSWLNMAAAPVKSPISTILYSTKPPPFFPWTRFDEMSQDWLCLFNSGITFNIFCAGNSFKQRHDTAMGYWLSPEAKCVLISPASGQEHGLFNEDGARQQDVPTTSNVIGAKKEKREKVFIGHSLNILLDFQIVITLINLTLKVIFWHRCIFRKVQVIHHTEETLIQEVSKRMSSQ